MSLDVGSLGSLEANVWAWEQVLPAKQKLVLLALADGWTPRHAAALAYRCGISAHELEDALRGLERRGMINRSGASRGEVLAGFWA